VTRFLDPPPPFLCASETRHHTTVLLHYPGLRFSADKIAVFPL
jgi:hypothetical protein